MSFGDGIAYFCAHIEERHGKMWASLAFVGIIGGALFIGMLFGYLITAEGRWDADRMYPNQLPCSESHVCDTFHGYVAHDLKQWWNEDIKKL